MVEHSKVDATIGWDASPITTARMCAEVYNQIKDEDWSVVGTAIRLSWMHRLWDIKKPYQWNGGSGGAGVGYNLPASIGAALANKKHGRFTVAFGGDGDFMFNPGALWTAAHHQIPILYIIHNNRAYHQEYMYLPAMAARHGRGVDPWISAPRSRTRTSTTPRSRAAWASTARARSPIRTISRRRSSAPSRWSRPAGRPWSTS